MKVRPVVSEFLGTLLLLATIVGSGIMAERLAGGNQAIALLGNTIPTGAMLVVLILIFGPISGAHFNPLVTLTFLWRGEARREEAFAYIAAQFAGGLGGLAGAPHVRRTFAPNLPQGAGRAGDGHLRVRGDLRVDCHHLRRGAPSRRYGTLGGRALHHRCLLVHGVNPLLILLWPPPVR